VATQCFPSSAKDGTASAVLRTTTEASVKLRDIAFLLTVQGSGLKPMTLQLTIKFRPTPANSRAWRGTRRECHRAESGCRPFMGLENGMDTGLKLHQRPGIETDLLSKEAAASRGVQI